jgi:cyclopropane-fatty-acyl-phospholipid synthase
MLELTVGRAGLQDGDTILDLGCGWGSLSLFMAAKFPKSRITGVSNSASQREFILARAKERGFRNLNIVTCDMNEFDPDSTFDRVISVEMFEHMRNYDVLLRRISTWLKPGGTLFVHIFAHRHFAYPFEVSGSGDWMAEHFFTGGIMPSVGLLGQFGRDMQIVRQWIVNGQNYQRTSEEWLLRTDGHREEILRLFAGVYGERDALRWLVRWRVFFIACAELFGYSGGNEWVVAHYLFARNVDLP